MIRLSTPPLSPNIIKALNQLDINTQADLQRTSSVKAFLLLKEQGLTITLATLWALEASILNIAPNQLSPTQKQTLQAALKNHSPVAVFPSAEIMQDFMYQALSQAKDAEKQGEVPVGAVVVQNGFVIAAGFNQCIQANHIAKHAELVAIEKACHKLQNYRLDDCDLYITLEPCPMCASAIIQSRIKRVIFGAAEAKMGAAGSLLDLFENKHNTHTAILGGVLAAESQQLLQQFFQKRR